MKDVLFENLEHIEAPKGWKAVWFPDWTVSAVEIVTDVIHGDMRVSDAVEQLRQDWDDLQAQYT
jgi:hypothetical protein